MKPRRPFAPWRRRANLPGPRQRPPAPRPQPSPSLRMGYEGTRPQRVRLDLAPSWELGSYREPAGELGAYLASRPDKHTLQRQRRRDRRRHGR